MENMGNSTNDAYFVHYLTDTKKNNFALPTF